MITLKELVATQYSDYKGSVSLDMQDISAGGFELLDLPKGVIIGAGFEFGELRGDCKLEKVTIYVLVADPSYGSSMQDFIDNAPKEGVKVSKVKKTIPVDKLGLFFKRFNCCGLSKDVKLDRIEL